MVRVRDALEKPITRSEPKPVPPSYSTRSKVKRPFQSADGGSSGTGRQSLEPPPKRQTKRGAKKHAGSSLKISDDATQESSNSQAHDQSSRVIKRKSRSHRPPPAHNKTHTKTINENTWAEVALQNDIVLEWLFSCLDRSDLLSARLVNKHWQRAGAKELRRRKFTMALSFDAHLKRPKNAFYNICRVMTECQTPLFLLSSLHVGVNSRDDLGSSGVKHIFKAVGNHLKNLTLFVDYSDKTTTFEKSPLMTHLQHLISLVPHLELLEIHFKVPSKWRTQLQILGSSDNHQNEYKEFHLPKLETFVVTGAAPAKFFAHVVKAAVNLKSLGGEFSQDFSSLVKYFLGPDGISKIHLLKDLRLLLVHRHDNADSQAADFETIQTFFNTHKKNLELETFGIAYQEFYSRFSEFSTKMQNVINQILEENSGTLKKLVIQPLRNFKVVAIPRLPKLQEIWFCCCSRSSDSLNFLPQGFDMNDRFPNVSSLVFLNCKVNSLRMYIQRLEIPTPVESVRYILVKVAPMSMMDLRMYGSSSPRPAVPADFRHLFPNLVSLTYKHTSKI